MKFTTICHGSKLYDDELTLRDIVLRIPLGLRLADEDLSAEVDHWHFGITGNNDELLACVVFVPLAGATAHLRQMAVANEQQRRGVGRTLVEHAECEVWSRGIERIVLHARVEAIGFYQRLGYECEGGHYLEVGIPHQTMSKKIMSKKISESRA